MFNIFGPCSACKKNKKREKEAVSRVGEKESKSEPPVGKHDQAKTLRTSADSENNEKIKDTQNLTEESSRAVIRRIRSISQQRNNCEIKNQTREINECNFDSHDIALIFDRIFLVLHCLLAPIVLIYSF